MHPRERAALRASGFARQAGLWRRAALIAAPIVATICLSAQAAFSAISAPSPAKAVVLQRAAETPDAAFRAGAVAASPAQGTTGTIELPPEPAILPVPPLADPSIVAARPFAADRASAVDRGRALECLATAIYYEAASEPDDGQRAVAQVVLNRVRHPAFPATVCGVVYQGSERTSGCQFSFACDGAMARTPARAGLARATGIAAAALNGQVFAPVGLATHYHTYAVTPAWNRTLVMTDAVGAHFFHRWKGYWGTAFAFRQGYQGGEPLPGPRARPTAHAGPIAAQLPTPVAAVVTPAAQVVAKHAEAGTPLARIDEASQVLDRWKDAGQPLR